MARAFEPALGRQESLPHKERYAAMWASARAAFDARRFQIDPLIAAPTRGLFGKFR